MEGGLELRAAFARFPINLSLRSFAKHRTGTDASIRMLIFADLFEQIEREELKLLDFRY